MAEIIADKIVEFDPASWKPDRDKDGGTEIFSESDAIETAARMLSEKGIRITYIWHAHDSAIEFAGAKEYISLGLSHDSAAAALMEAMQEISYIIDSISGIECYISANGGEHFFHIRNLETAAN